MSKILEILKKAALEKEKAAALQQKEEQHYRSLHQRLTEELMAFFTQFLPVKGVDYTDGRDGLDGKDGYTPQKGIDYFDGKDGKDAVFNIEEIRSLTQRAILAHEEEFDHLLLHDSLVLGSQTVDEEGIAEGRTLQVKGKKLIYVDLPKPTIHGRRDLFPSDGVGLPGQAGNSGKFLTTDGTTVSWSTVSQAATFVDRETPTGSVNDSNVTFTLANTPTAGSEHVYRNGILQESGEDYTISGATITFTTAPLTNSDVGGLPDKIRVSYRYT